MIFFKKQIIRLFFMSFFCASTYFIYSQEQMIQPVDKSLATSMKKKMSTLYTNVTKNIFGNNDEDRIAEFTSADQIQINLNDIDCDEQIKKSVEDVINFFKKSTNSLDHIDHGILIMDAFGDDAQEFAKAIAKEAGANFIEVYTSELLSGAEGAIQINKIFETAKKNAPCVIGIDEIADIVDSGTMKDDIYIDSLPEAAFKEQMNSLSSNHDKVILFDLNQYSNDNEDVSSDLNINRIIRLHHPLSEKQIITLLQEQLKNIKLASNVNISILGRLILKANSFEGKHITTQKNFESVVNIAQQLALKNGTGIVNMENFAQALYNFALGSQQTTFMQKIFRNTRAIATHEAGHVIAALYLTHGFQVIYQVTIIARGELNGLVTPLSLFKEQDDLTVDDYKKNIIFLLGGAVAEQLFGFHKSLGLLRKKEIGLAEILQETGRFGIETDLPLIYENISYIIKTYDIEADENYIENYNVKEKEILEECYEQALKLITQHKDQVQKVANLLIQKGTVSGDEIYDMLKIDKPLYDFEEGPLPQSLLENYALRKTSDEYAGDVELIN